MAKKKMLTVDAGNHARIHCPVSAVLSLEEVGDPQRVGMALAGVDKPVQAVVNGKEIELTWLLPRLRSEKKKKFELKKKRTINNTHGVEIVDEPGDHVAVFLNGKLFTNYYYGEAYPRPFLHPLIGPYGKTVTRDYPMPGGPEGEREDHPHHRSVWTAWGEISGADNWSELKGHGCVVHRKFEELRQGPIFGRITACNDWTNSSGNKICEEIREMTFYNLPSAVRMIDYNVTFLATEGRISFDDTKEGGILSVRVASSMDVPVSGTIMNSFGGKNENETWGKPSHWCDYTGKVDGQTVGVAIFDHPSNFRHPTTWHVRNYGLMTANPFGLSCFTGDEENDGSHKVPAGEEFKFRYRLFVHKGTAEEAEVAERYHDYVNPPSIEHG